MNKPNSILLKIVLGLFLFLIAYCSYSQAIFKGSIVDFETGEAIPYATVFLANTTIGTSSDEEGKFSIYLPEGNYEVIVRMLGYEGITFNLASTMVKPQGYKFLLVPFDEELESLDVEESRDPAWYKNLEDFKRYFLGTSENGKSAYIRNDLALILDDQTEPGILLASSRDILTIHNINLGYQVDYLLDYFRYDHRQGFVTYSGFPLFIPDSSLSRSKERRVERKRMEAYYGSLQHFLSAIYDGKTVAAGYEIRRLYRIEDPDHPGKFIDSLGTELLTSIAIRKNRDRKEYLEFKDYLHVTYLKERESALYVRGLGRAAQNSQTSIMKMTVESTEVFENGSLSDPFGVIVEGYMGWERVGDMLPIGYVPVAKDEIGKQ